MPLCGVVAAPLMSRPLGLSANPSMAAERQDVATDKAWHEHAKAEWRQQQDEIVESTERWNRFTEVERGGIDLTNPAHLRIFILGDMGAWVSLRRPGRRDVRRLIWRQRGRLSGIPSHSIRGRPRSRALKPLGLASPWPSQARLGLSLKEERI